MDENANRKKKVLCPCSTKEGKTYWVRMGSAYVNRDNSINVYLDSLPVNGKLQIREWDEPRREGTDDRNLRLVPRDGAGDQLPF